MENSISFLLVLFSLIGLISFIRFLYKYCTERFEESVGEIVKKSLAETGLRELPFQFKCLANLTESLDRKYSYLSSDLSKVEQKYLNLSTDLFNLSKVFEKNLPPQSKGKKKCNPSHGS